MGVAAWPIVGRRSSAGASCVPSDRPILCPNGKFGGFCSLWGTDIGSTTVSYPAVPTSRFRAAEKPYSFTAVSGTAMAVGLGGRQNRDSIIGSRNSPAMLSAIELRSRQSRRKGGERLSFGSASWSKPMLCRKRSAISSMTPDRQRRNEMLAPIEACVSCKH